MPNSFFPKKIEISPKIYAYTEISPEYKGLQDIGLKKLGGMIQKFH